MRIGILGDFNPDFRSHHATNDALQHSAAKLKIEVESQWIPTPSLVEPNAHQVLERFDGLWASPGSPYKSAEGMLKGIEFARRRDWPFLGTCGGFQYTLIECARNVLGIKDADTSGMVAEIRLRPGSYLQSFYTKDVVQEEFFCNFEVNPEFEWVSIEAGFPVAARGSQGEARAIESPTHRFFLATLFQPQLSSKPKKPHPLVMAFVQAAADWSKKRLDDSILV